MKLSVVWKPGNPMKCEAYLDGKLLEGCRYIKADIALRPAEGCVLKGEKEGHFTFKDGIVREEKYHERRN